MLLRVGPFLYRVHFVDGYIDHEGQPCLGLCDNDTHELFISTVPDLAQQLQVIGHEYLEAWIYHFGTGAGDKEAYCDLFGLAMAQLMLDLTHQLHHLATPATSATPTTPGVPAPSRADSPACAGGEPATGAGARARQPSRVRSPIRHLARKRAFAAGVERGVTAPPGAAGELAALAVELGLGVERVFEPGGAER
ncbi:MAG: hypothetical protein WD316_11005 [Phycisphaeraceae bacterium]